MKSNNALFYYRISFAAVEPGKTPPSEWDWTWQDTEEPRLKMGVLERCTRLEISLTLQELSGPIAKFLYRYKFRVRAVTSEQLRGQVRLLPWNFNVFLKIVF